MTASLMVVAPEAGAGKTIVTLGLLHQFERHGIRAAYFKPVGVGSGGGEPDADVRFVRGMLGLRQDPNDLIAVHHEAVATAIHDGRYDDIIDSIIEKHGQMAQGVDLVVCEGVDSHRAFPALDKDINLDIAKNIDAMVLLVANGYERSVTEIVQNIMWARGQLVDGGVEVLGVVVNRVDPKRQGAMSDALRLELRAEGVTLMGVLPSLEVLARPRVHDIVKALSAHVISGGEHLNATVSTFLVTAMGLENALHYFEDGCLLITPGDREEILLAAAATYASQTAPRPSCVLLTGGFEPRRKVMQLVDSLSAGRLPILRVDAHTFATALAVSQVEPQLEDHQDDKALAIHHAVEEYINIDALIDHKLVPSHPVVTPRRFVRMLREQARATKKTIVLPEGNVSRIIQAAGELRRRNLVDLILLGDEIEIRRLAEQLGVQLDAGVQIINPATDAQVEEYADTLVELRQHKGMHKELARDLMTDRTYFGTMLVHKGRADGMVSGATTTTQATLRPAFEFIRARPGFKTVSSVFLMCLPDRVLVYGDCAVIPKPTAEQLAEIALASAKTAAGFGIEPRVAMLSYSTGESGQGADVDLVREATRLVRERSPELLVEGPIQYDAAVEPDVARTKMPDSLVAGRANVLVFPDLNTGNNTYKAVQRSAGAIAIGPVLQGLRRPVNDLSRGATIVDIVNTVVVTAIQAQDPEL